VLSPEDRLDAVFTVTRQASKKKEPTIKDIDKAVKSIRRKAYVSGTALNNSTHPTPTGLIPRYLVISASIKCYRKRNNHTVS